MAQPERIFRQAALDRLSSPEQLDQLMQVTTPKSWMSLAAFGALLLTALIWAIFGKIADQVHGRGIFLNADGVFVVAARGEGSVEELLVHHQGDTVTNDQLVALIRQPELKIKLSQAKTNYDAIEASFKDLERSQKREEADEQEDSNAQRELLSRMITNYTAMVTALTARSKAVTKLDEKGLETIPQILEAQTALYTAQYDLSRTRMQRKQLEMTQNQADVRRRQQLDERKDQCRQAMQQVVYLSNLYVLNTEVRSPYPGQILEVLVKPGDLIAASTPIASLQGSTNALEACIFLNSSDGKRLASRFQRARGRSLIPSRSRIAASEPMEALLAPVSVKKEEFGLMRGEVEEVSPYPVTPQGMLRVLQNPTLVGEFSQAGAPIEVRVTLSKTNTESGFVWTSGKGPPMPITSGTLCEGTITIDRRPPISLVLPFLSKSFRN